MCALVGSFDLLKFRELVELNSSRGSHSWSCTIFNKYGDIRVLNKGMGQFDFRTLLDAKAGDYVFGHVQAPTTEARDITSVHPAFAGDSYLWHNGILLASTIAQLQVETELLDEKWDTKLLAAKIEKDQWEGLLEVQGSFSCARFNNAEGLHFFRNEISPLFYDMSGNISSTKFENSVPTDPGRVYMMSFKYEHLLKTDQTFKNNENPFFFTE